MAVNRLIAVLPCYSLDDIAKELSAPQIAAFHAAWTVLWHPSLLAVAAGIPEWKRADGSSLDLEQALILIPSNLSNSPDAPLIERLVVQNCTIATAETSRTVTLENVFKALEATRALHTELELPPSDPPLMDLHGRPKTQIQIEDFYALGLATLIVQALTRKIHYSSNLDVVLFAEQVSTAAKAFLNCDALECERWLQSCFDQLSQERDRYFTQSAHLIDLTLLANTTLQRSLDRQLARTHPQNLLASPAILEQLNRTNPAALKVVVDSIASKRLTIAGGSGLTNDHFNEISLSTQANYGWLPQKALYLRLNQARQDYVKQGVPPPEVFAQMEPGMVWTMPSVLKNIGYKAALLHAFTDTVYPVPTQSKIAWESSDNKTIDAIASGYVDASIPKSVFSMISDLGKQFDYHQIPTLVFAHWPDRCCDAFNDIVTATRRTSSLGQWSTLTAYFESTGRPYSNQKFANSQFAFPIPITRREYAANALALQRNQYKLFNIESTNNLAIITDLILRGKTAYSEAAQAILGSDYHNSNFDNQTAATVADSQRSEQLRESIGMSLAKSIPREEKHLSATDGLLLFNPLSGPQRVYLTLTQGSLESADSQRIYATHAGSNTTEMIVDLPPMGVLQLQRKVVHTNDSYRPRGKPNQGPLIGSSSWLLANEFIECQIDPKSGYLRSLMVARKRGGKLSGMPAIAVDKSDASGTSLYAVPANVTNQFVFNSPLRATIRSRGELVLERKCYGTFSVEYTLWRGARHVDISVNYTIAPALHTGNKASDQVSDNDTLWHLAPIWRTAWPSPTTTISTWIHGSRSKSQGPNTNGSNIFAPELVEFDDVEHRLYLTTIGAPIHRRIDSMFLETLVPSCETGAKHQFRLGMDWPRPYQTCLESMETTWQVEDSLGSFRSGGSQWMAQVNQPNLRVTCLQLLKTSDSKPDGIRLMVQETLGKSSICKLSFYRDVFTASKVLVDGTATEPLEIESGEAVLSVTGNECSFVDVFFGNGSSHNPHEVIKTV